MAGNPKNQECTLWPSASGWPEIILKRMRNQNGNVNQGGQQENMIQELPKMQMQMGISMMQQQQAAVQAQVPNQIPWHQQHQPAHQNIPQQQNFGYGVQMPQRYGGMAQQMPNMQKKFNMGQMGGQHFF